MHPEEEACRAELIRLEENVKAGFLLRDKAREERKKKRLESLLTRIVELGKEKKNIEEQLDELADRRAILRRRIVVLGHQKHHAEMDLIVKLHFPLHAPKSLDQTSEEHYKKKIASVDEEIRSAEIDRNDIIHSLTEKGQCLDRLLRDMDEAKEALSQPIQPQVDQEMEEDLRQRIRKMVKQIVILAKLSRQLTLDKGAQQREKWLSQLSKLTPSHSFHQPPANIPSSASTDWAVSYYQQENV